MNQSDVKKLIKDEIDKFVNNLLDKEMKRVLQKSNSQSRTEVTDTIKDALESVYKMLWTKRSFWKTDIK